jgi:DNA-binding GntR family transcriptional regulator
MRPDEIASVLRSALRERVFPPGQALNQDDLARRFGVSRIPLREALRTLVGEGLILMKPGLGAVVTELQAEEVAELYGLRLQLEPPLSSHIMRQVRQGDIEDLERFVAAMGLLGSRRPEEWSDLNYRFHRRLYEVSEQKHSVRLVVQVLNLVEPYARVDAHVLGARARMQADRLAMIQALRAGDAQQLQSLIRAGLEADRAELIASMPTHPESADELHLLRDIADL